MLELIGDSEKSWESNGIKVKGSNKEEEKNMGRWKQNNFV